MKNLFWLVPVLLTFSIFSCQKNTINIHLEKGMVISESVTVAKDIYKINTAHNFSDQALTIQGNNITIDFQGATLQGSNDIVDSKKYYGNGILVKGENIVIKNLTIKNYGVALKADNTSNLEISGSSFIFNNRHYTDKKGKVTRSELSRGPRPSDLKVPTIYFDNCTDVSFHDNIVSNNRHGLTVQAGRNIKIYNNKITHNAGFGIITNVSSNVLIMHNYLDWNILNNSWINGNYVKTLDAGGIDMRNDSTENKNIIAYNSITHCSDNDFGKSIVFQNDFFPFSIDSIYQNNNTKTIDPLPNGQKITSANYNYWGKEYILVNEWGPYNFSYPTIWLREINDDKYTFAIFGPEGNWKIVDGNGFSQTSRQSGSVPATIVATAADTSQQNLSLQLEFIGVEFTDQFGNINTRGKTFKFGFQNDDE